MKLGNYINRVTARINPKARIVNNFSNLFMNYLTLSGNKRKSCHKKYIEKDEIAKFSKLRIDSNNGIVTVILLLITTVTLFNSSFASIEAVATNEELQKSLDKSQDRESLDGPESWYSSTVPFFGSNLFQGNFKDVNFIGFNPHYQISQDDEIALHFWGALSIEQISKVDSQGNIFVPEIGNIKVLGVRQEDLNKHIKKSISRVFNENVEVYANLLSSKMVKVFVTGNVTKPGLYEGMSAGSILSYIDLAGGIDLEKGSFRNIEIVRKGKTIKNLDLYDFLINGSMEYVQLQEGDSIKIAQKGAFVYAIGLIRNKNRFELPIGGDNEEFFGKDLLSYVNHFDSVTNVIVSRNTAETIENFTLNLDDFLEFELVAGDKVEFISEATQKNIVVIVDGEHSGNSRFVLPYGKAKLADVLEKIKTNDRSAMNSMILYRRSAAERQKKVLNSVLDIFEQKMISYSPVSTEDAKIHKNEIENMLKFVQKARNHKPNGIINVLDEDGKSINYDIELENQDVVYVPKKTNLISTFGYVNAPTFLSYVKGRKIKYYLKQSGGLTDNAEDDYFLLRKLNGKVLKVKKSYKPSPGDEIIVLPKVHVKSLQISKDLMQIIYQMAITARVAVLL